MPGVVVATPRTLRPRQHAQSRATARDVKRPVLQWGDGDGGLRPGAHRHPAARRDDPAQPDPNDRGARVPRGDRLAPPAHPLELLRVRRARPRPRQEPDARRAREGRPGRALVTQLRRVDAGAVRHRRDRRDPRQHQSRLPHPRAGVRAQPVGMPLDHRRARVQDVATTWRWCPRSPRSALRWSGRCSSGPTSGTISPRATRWCPTRRSPSGATRCTPTTRSTSSTRRARPGSRRAPRSRTATSSTTATSRPSCRASPTRTGCASRCPSTTASGW